MKNKRLFLTAIVFIGLISTTIAQVPNYVPISGLAAWYSFNGSANDDSGGNNHGNVNGAILTTGKSGFANTAYLFNGVSNTIQLADPFLGGNQNSAFTFHALIYLNSLNSSQVIWSKTLFWGEVSFNINSLNEISFFWANSITGNKYSSINSISNTIQQNQWYDIVVTYENSTAQIYLNGQPITTNLNWAAQGGNIISTLQIEDSCNFAQDPNSSMFGAINNSSFFNGKIDELGVWNRALTQQEISDLYNGNNADITSISNVTIITVSPNPAQNEINIIGEVFIDNSYITALDGKRVYLENSGNKILLPNLSNGIYTLCIETNNGETLVKKITIYK
jgi:hypothetical protein